MVSLALRLAVAVVAAVTLCSAGPDHDHGHGHGHGDGDGDRHKKCFGAKPVANFSMTQFAGAWVPVWSYSQGRDPPCRVLNFQPINATAVLFQLFTPSNTNITTLPNGTVSVTFSGNATFTNVLNLNGSTFGHEDCRMPKRSGRRFSRPHAHRCEEAVLSTNYTDYAVVLHCGGHSRPKGAVLLSRTGVLADDVANELKKSLTRYGIRATWFRRERCFPANPPKVPLTATPTNPPPTTPTNSTPTTPTNSTPTTPTNPTPTTP